MRLSPTQQTEEATAYLSQVGGLGFPSATVEVMQPTRDLICRERHRAYLRGGGGAYPQSCVVRHCAYRLLHNPKGLAHGKALRPRPTVHL
jgi:hypothetical protein